MAFESGIFQSTSVTVNGDGIPVGNKAVTAAFLAKIFYQLKGDGISLRPTSAFYVAPVSGLTARVSAGWGLMSGYPFAETTDYDITMNSSTSEQTLYIGVRLDVASGEYTDNHVAARTTFVAATDRVFAVIVIPANAVTLTSAMITDVRSQPAYCGLIDEYDVTLQEMIQTFFENGLPIHASTHSVGGDDELTGYVAYGAQSPSSGDATQARTNIRAAKAVDGVADAIEAAVVINAQTTSQTAALTDLGKDIQINSASATTLTIPPQSSVTWVDKSYFFVTRMGAGTLTITPGSGVTINAPGARLKIAERYGTVLCRRLSENIWIVTGSCVL